MQTNRKRLSQIEKKFGIDLGVPSDSKMYANLRKIGLPSLAKLLKMVKNK